MNVVSTQTPAANILVLEDDPVHRLLLEHEFQGNRYCLKSAGDATGALRLIQVGGVNYQVGIFDLKVPSEAGDFPRIDAALQVITSARELFPEMTIIIISSVFIGEELRSKLDALAVKDIFEKPFSLEKLHEFVNSRLE